MDTTAAVARLSALTQVRDQVLADILLSKSQLGMQIDDSSLTENQMFRLQSLKSELQTRINAYRNSVKQAQYNLDSLQSRLSSKEGSWPCVRLHS